LFTGDTLYAQGVGLSDLPGEKPELLKKSILSIWGTLTSNRWIFPGHGKAIEGDRLKRENADLLRFLGLIT
jgi:glyoxylase-like metal-dependent hydrolase (beta-lactamase superfamily II)